MDRSKQKMAMFHPLSSTLDFLHSFFDDFSDHLDENRVIVGAIGAQKTHAVIFGDFPGLDVEIIKHLDMIANKTDGRDDDFFAAVVG
jgi:hypothetical protein